MHTSEKSATDDDDDDGSLSSFVERSACANCV